jgi:hypothetical protein
MGKMVFKGERSGEIQKNPQEYYRQARVVARERAAAQLKAEKRAAAVKQGTSGRPGRVMYG